MRREHAERMVMPPLPNGQRRIFLDREGKRLPRVYSSNSQCDRQREIFALSKTFFRRNTDVFQGKMVQLSAKRTAVRVRWQLGECTPGNRPQVNLLTCGLLLFDIQLVK